MNEKQEIELRKKIANIISEETAIVVPKNILKVNLIGRIVELVKEYDKPKEII